MEGMQYAPAKLRKVVQETRCRDRMERFQMRLGCLAATALVPVILSPARGHHSEAGFDTDAVVAFQGTVTDFNWRNPHVYIDV